LGGAFWDSWDDAGVGDVDDFGGAAWGFASVWDGYQELRFNRGGFVKSIYKLLRREGLTNAEARYRIVLEHIYGDVHYASYDLTAMIVMNLEI
jgi:hypothetical protein